MHKRTMTFKDYNGQERTEDFYFHLSKAELVEMELGTKGGLVENLQTIIQTEDGEQIINTFKKIVLQAYGEKSPDGREFMKSKKIRRRFAQTEAYSDLFMLFATDAEEAAKFMRGIMPSDLAEEVAKIEKNSPKQDLLEKYQGRARSGTSALISQEMADRSKALDNPVPVTTNLEELSREELIRLATISQDNLRKSEG